MNNNNIYILYLFINHFFYIQDIIFQNPFHIFLFSL